jgi:c-di-GMP-binding flagellar brake protein YcgR
MLSTLKNVRLSVTEPKIDLRQTPRRKIHTHLKISRMIDGQKKLVPGYVRNISEGGIAAFVPGQLSVGEVVELEFTIPNLGKIIAERARVRTVEIFQHGLEFVGLSELSRRAIAAYCCPVAA